MSRPGGALFACATVLALSGCAAAAIPLAAGAAMANSKGTTPRDRTPVPPPSARQPVFAGESGTQTSILGNPALEPTAKTMGPVLEPTPTPTPVPAAPTFTAPRREPALAPAKAPPPPTPAPAVAIALPPPKPAPVSTGTGGFADFTRYALAHAADAPGEARLSQLVDPDTLTDKPQQLSCGAKPPAVAIDLDPAGKTFDPADPPSPVPGLAEALAQLRAAGVVIFWKSSLNVAQADKVYTVLRAVGLDPDRTDRLLLTKGDQRKEARLLAAAQEWCFVALAGDRKGDFLEALDYLRDPDGPVAEAIKPRYGDGWFLTPTPIG